MKLPLQLLLATSLLLPLAARAQVGIGNTNPNAKAALDITATDKGLLIPRLTAAQRTAIASPPQGLLVYQTDGTAAGGSQTGFWYYAGTSAAWVYLSQAGGTAGGDLTGSYPNPTIAAGAVATAKLADNAVTNAKVADDAIGIAELSAGGTASATTYLRGDNTWADPGATSWSLSGNTLNGTQFIGSLNDQDFVVRRNNAEAFRLFSNGRLTVGNNTYASSSVMLGFNAGATFNTVTGDNTHAQAVFVGAKAGETNNADGNTFIGFSAGQKATGYTNTIIGSLAGARMTTGNNNIVIGSQAVYNSSITPTGSSNIVVGVGAGAGITTNSNNILIGGSSNASAGLYDGYVLGNGATVTQNNTLAIGDVRGANDAVSVGIGTTAPTSSLQVNGTFAVGVVNNFGGGGSSASSNALDQGSISLTNIIGGYYGLTPTGSGQYYALPVASTCVGRVYYLRNNSGTNPAILTVSSGQLIDSASGSGTGLYTLNTSGSSKTVIAVSDGTNWTIMRTGS